MYQPRIKLKFIRRYCLPKKGWHVHVDIDGAEKGLNPENYKRQKDWKKVEKNFKYHSVFYKGCFSQWLKENCLQLISDARDILAFLRRRDMLAFHLKHPKTCLIAEVEGASGRRQSEQKVYSAVGQLVRAMGIKLPDGWHYKLYLAVNGKELADNLAKMKPGLKKLGIKCVVINE
jgi:hypothetical protein